MKKPRRIFLLIPILIVAGIMVWKFVLSTQIFLYAGTLEATKVDLSARVASAISQVRIQEGDKVKAGDTLVTLDCEDIKIAARLAHENYDRYIKLAKSGTATPETLDQVRNRKEDADTKLSWCTIQSPITGTILSRYHEPGEWMNPGTKILTLANIQDIWAYIYVPQPLVAKLSPGMTLKGYLPELNRREFDGKILKINEEAEFTPKNVQTQSERERLVFGVKVSFKDSNRSEILKPGMTIEVELPQ